MRLEDHIRTIPDFPKPGILFRDVTTLIGHAGAFSYSVEALVESAAAWRPDLVVGLEARGFIFGGAAAAKLGLGFAPFRKRGKLPWRVIGASYTLEYGEERMEAHEDAVKPGQRVLIIDDLIATGGTGLAAMQLVRQLGGVPCGFGAIIDLPDLGGARAIAAAGAPVAALVEFPGH